MNNIPFLSFDYRNEETRKQIINKFEDFFDKKWYVLGEEVDKFEKEFAEFNETKYAIGVSNGLDALHLSLRALNIGEGDEVIIPSNTFIATALAVSYVGATPVFVEPRTTTCNINPDLIEGAITDRTKAIMPVHLYGQACEMKAITDLAKKYNLFVIEDNAQAIGAEWNGKLTGSFGNASGVSFYPGKNLGALGDAGAVTTDNEETAKKVLSLRNYGSQKKYHNEIIGYNNRIDECQAGFLRVFLQHLNKWNEERNKIAEQYNDLLKDIKEVTLTEIADGGTSVYHLYVIRIEKRDELQSYLNEKGIGTLIHYPIPPHLQECYSDLGYSEGDFPIAEKMSKTCLSLPLYPGLTEKEVYYVAKCINNFYSAD